MSEAWEFFDAIFDLLLAKYSSQICDDEIIEKIIKFIYFHVKKEINDYDFGANKATENVKYKHDISKIDICISNILKIKYLLEETEESRDTFIGIFPLWEKQRKENVDKLNKIAKTLHDEKKVINAAKMIGSAVGIVGGAAILTSIFFPPVAAAVTAIPSWFGGSTVAALLPSFFRKAPVPVKSICAITGGALSATGTVSQLGTAITEMVLLKKNIDEAKSIVEEDKESFTVMNKWFNHTEELRKTMESLLDATLWKIVLKDFYLFFETLHKLKKFRNCDEIMSKLKCFLPQLSKKIDVHNIFPPEYTLPIVGLLFVMFLIMRDNRILLSCILVTVNTVSACNVIGSGLRTAPAVVAMTTPGAMRGIKRAPKVLVRDATVGICAGLGMALEAASLVLTTIDVSKGSVSEPGKEIEEVSNQLNEEYKVLEEVNREIVQSIRDKQFFGRLHY